MMMMMMDGDCNQMNVNCLIASGVVGVVIGLANHQAFLMFQ